MRHEVLLARTPAVCWMPFKRVASRPSDRLEVKSALFQHRPNGFSDARAIDDEDGVGIIQGRVVAQRHDMIRYAGIIESQLEPVR